MTLSSGHATGDPRCGPRGGRAGTARRRIRLLPPDEDHRGRQREPGRLRRAADVLIGRELRQGPLHPHLRRDGRGPGHVPVPEQRRQRRQPADDPHRRGRGGRLAG